MLDDSFPAINDIDDSVGATVPGFQQRTLFLDGLGWSTHGCMDGILDG